MAIAMTQPPMSGLSGLVNFTDDLQEADTGLDRIALLRQIQQEPMIQREGGGMISESTLPGLQAMERVRSELEQQIDLAGLQELMMDQEEEEPLTQEDYMQYSASGGLVGLPVVQAGFGGFLKKAGRFINKMPGMTIFRKAIVKPLSRSKLGRAALNIAPVLFLGNPLLAAAVAGSIKLAQDPKMEGNPYKVVQAAGKTYAGAKLGQAIRGTPASGDALAGTKAALGTVPPPDAAATNVWKDLAQSVLGGPGGATYDPAGTFVSRLGERLANTGQFADTTWKQELGLEGLLKDQQAQAADADSERFHNITKDAAQAADSTPVIEANAAEANKAFHGLTGTTQDPTILSKTKDIIGKIPMSAKIGAGASILSSLMGGKSEAEIDPSIAGLTRRQVETDFDKQAFQYYKDGQPIDTETALGLIAEAYRSYDPTGKDRAIIDTGVDSEIIDPARLGTSVESYDKFDKDLGPEVAGYKTGGYVDLQNNGGLIGMAYGGEFAGQVGGRGHGMQDNVYMPIIERQAGEQVGTLAVSPDEYVVDSYTMSLLGNGSPDAGAQVMDKTIKDIRLQATGQPNQQQEIDGLEALNRMRSV